MLLRVRLDMAARASMTSIWDSPAERYARRRKLTEISDRAPYQLSGIMLLPTNGLELCSLPTDWDTHIQERKDGI